jgi:hypothetical protein
LFSEQPPQPVAMRQATDYSVQVAPEHLYVVDKQALAAAISGAPR